MRWICLPSGHVTHQLPSLLRVLLKFSVQHAPHTHKFTASTSVRLHCCQHIMEWPTPNCPLVPVRSVCHVVLHGETKPNLAGRISLAADVPQRLPGVLGFDRTLLVPQQTPAIQLDNLSWSQIRVDEGRAGWGIRFHWSSSTPVCYGVCVVGRQRGYYRYVCVRFACAKRQLVGWVNQHIKARAFGCRVGYFIACLLSTTLLDAKHLLLCRMLHISVGGTLCGNRSSFVCSALNCSTRRRADSATSSPSVCVMISSATRGARCGHRQPRKNKKNAGYRSRTTTTTTACPRHLYTVEIGTISVLGRVFYSTPCSALVGDVLILFVVLPEWKMILLLLLWTYHTTPPTRILSMPSWPPSYHNQSTERYIYLLIHHYDHK